MTLFRFLFARLLSLIMIWGLLTGFAGEKAQAMPALHPGFQSLGIWEAASGLRLDVALWYPCRRAPSSIRYDDWSFSAARGARPVEGRHPLILLSHDSAGSRFSLNLLASHLASKGFVVAAPTHTGDNVDDMSRVFSLEHIAGRTAELHALLTELIRSPQTEGLIDPQRIGVLGVGPGATAALLLTGGRLDPSGWKDYCARAGNSDPYCTPWPASRMEKMAADPALSVNRQDRRIRAAAVVAPAYGMLFSRRSLSGLRLPLLLLRADLDAVNKAPHHADAIRAALPQEPDFAVLNNTDSASLMAPCSPTLVQTLPEMCTGVPPEQRENSQKQLGDRAAAFFLKTLGMPHLPPLPEEPVPNEMDVPPKEPPALEPVKTETAKRKTRGR